MAQGTALAANDRLTVRDGLSVLAPLEDHLAMLLKGVQARLQSMKHRDGAIGLLSLLNQLVNDLFCRAIRSSAIAMCRSAWAR